MTLRMLFLILVLSVVFTHYIPVDPLAQNAQDYAISSENQLERPLTSDGQQIEEHHAALLPLNYRRVIFYSKPRAMYADYVKSIAAEGILTLQGFVRLDMGNVLAEGTMAKIA
jgi:hypothetical protein